MALHDSLRELVEVRGVAVTEDATEFRGALDDYLAEDEATTGEVNLLVDAVRLGGLRRLLDVLDHGATPEAAVRDAAMVLARDRGSDDVRRAGWALAVLGHALGRLPVGMIGSFSAPSDQMHVPTLDSPEARPDPVETQTLSGRPAPPTEPSLPAPLPPQPYPRQPYPQPVSVPTRSRRRGLPWVLLAVALVLGLAAGIGVALWTGRDGDGTAGDDGTDSPNGAGGLPESEIVANYVTSDDDGETSTLYRIDPASGEYDDLAGPTARVSAISPDRETIVYLEGPQPFTAIAYDVETGEEEPLFDEDSDCAHSLRPGWSPDGERFALICLDEDLPRGIYVADASGGEPEPVLEGTDFRGAPTWISDTRFVFGRSDDDGGTSLWVETLDDGADPVLLEPPPGMEMSHPDWNPQQQELLFLARPAGTPDDDAPGQLWAYDAALENARQLSDPIVNSPVVSPDGEQVAVVAQNPEFEEQLAVMDWESGQLAFVPDPPPGSIGIPVWGSR